MLEGFIEYLNDLGGNYAGSFSRICNLNSQLNQQKRDYEEKITELEAKKEELEARVEELDEWSKERLKKH